MKSSELSTPKNGTLTTPRPAAVFGERGIIINQYDELVRFAQTVASSGLAPKGMEKPESIFVAVQMGLEVGLPPMAALQNIAVINGRPAIWGDAQLAVCRGTGQMEIFEEWFEVGGEKTRRNPQTFTDDVTAVCRVKREGGQEIESAFSVADAKRANLWGKAGPWTQYPSRMLRNRARSFALRDGFGDALKGFRSVEEVRDDPAEREVSGRVIQAEPKLFVQPAESSAPSEEFQETPNGAQGEPAPAGPEEGAAAEETKASPGSPPADPGPKVTLSEAMEADGYTLDDINKVIVACKLDKKTYASLGDMPPKLRQTLLDNWTDVRAHLQK